MNECSGPLQSGLKESCCYRKVRPRDNQQVKVVLYTMLVSVVKQGFMCSQLESRRLVTVSFRLFLVSFPCFYQSLVSYFVFSFYVLQLVSASSLCDIIYSGLLSSTSLRANSECTYSILHCIT